MKTRILSLALVFAFVLSFTAFMPVSAENAERITLSALINMGNTMTYDPDDMPSFQRFYEETNIKVEWEVVRSGWDDRKNMQFASGDIPDMLFGNRTIRMPDIMSNLDVFMKLNDYLLDAPNIQRMYAEEPSLMKLSMLPDGSIYSLPHRMPLRPDTFDGQYINKTWLDELGLDIPETSEDLYEVLKAFKERDPNGNDEADEIPYSFQGTGTMFGTYWIFGMFGIADNIWGERIEIRDGELLYIATDDGFKEGLKYMRRLYREGLLDPECFTQDWSQWQSKCQSTDPMVIGTAGMWTQTALFGNAAAPNFVTLPPLKGPNGDQRWRANYVNLRSDPCTWAMSAACSDPEAAIRFIDHIYNPANSVQLYFGSYGEGIELLSDGQIEIKPTPEGMSSYDDFIWHVGFGDMGPYYISRDFEKNIIPNRWVLDKGEINDVYLPFCPKPEEVFPTMNYELDTANEIAIIRTDLDNIINEKMAAWVTDQADIDEEWDSYLSQLDQVGLPRLMEIYNEAYENYKAS